MKHGKFERLGEETPKKTGKANWKMVVTKTDTKAVAIGLKRTLLALMTLMTFGVAVFGFIRTASSYGYAAVVLFFASVLVMIVSFIFLYAQGITNKTSEESKGEK
jgi:uncharacterized membrane protein YphA (DoxX/SURF4 family)